jgi:hypothetical protein
MHKSCLNAVGHLNDPKRESAYSGVLAEGTVVEFHKNGDLLLQCHCGAQLRLTGVLVILYFSKNLIKGSKLVQNNLKDIQINENGMQKIHVKNVL